MEEKVAMLLFVLKTHVWKLLNWHLVEAGCVLKNLKAVRGDEESLSNTAVLGQLAM